MAGPLEQFTIKPLAALNVGGIDASFTNSSAVMVATVAVAAAFLILSMRGRALVPGRWQSMAELSYEFVASMIRDNVGTQGRAFFPFIFSLFMFILLGNLIGLLPYSFTFTSHIIVTFALAMTVFIGVTIVGFAKHGVKFLTFFVPGGVHWVMLLLLVPIEILSYLSRPISLSIRLFANMTAGHTMVKVFAAFIIPLGFLGGWMPLGINVLLSGFEFIVAFLQAYVFTVLTCIYLNDALDLH